MEVYKAFLRLLIKQYCDKVSPYFSEGAGGKFIVS